MSELSAATSATVDKVWKLYPVGLPINNKFNSLNTPKTKLYPIRNTAVINTFIIILLPSLAAFSGFIKYDINDTPSLNTTKTNTSACILSIKGDIKSDIEL